MSFGEGTKFTTKRRKSGIATVISKYIKVVNSLAIFETCM